MSDKQSIASSFANAGLNLSTDPMSFRDGDYSFMLNGAVHGIEGKNPTARMMRGNIFSSYLPSGFYPINGNKVPISQNRECIFSVHPGTGEGQIGIFDGSAYTPVVSSKNLGFKITNQIQAVYDKDFTDKEIVIWVDDLNDVRFMDLRNPPLLNGQLDIDALSVFRQSDYPNLSVSEITNNGNCLAGGYYFSFQYSDANGNGITTPTTPIGPIPIYRDSISSWDIINGSPDREPTSKAIRLAISNLDPSYKFYNILVIKSFGGIREAFIAATNSVSQTEYLYTGNPENEISMLLDEIITPAASYKSAKTIALSEGTVLLGNLKGTPDFNLQPFISQIQVQWQAKKELYNEASKSYANPLNCLYELQYRRGEVYSFGVVIRWNDGSKSRWYPLISRELNKRIDGTTITRTFDQYSQPVASGQWDTYKPSLTDDIYETGPIPERWKVYNTAIALGDPAAAADSGPSIYGEFAYHESTDRYPNDPLVWGANAGQPIRDFKMPDHSILPITDGNGTSRTDGDMDKVHIYKLGIRLNNVEDIMKSLPDEVKKRMTGWEIVRADRRGNKSIIASGLLHNMWEQNWRESDTSIFFNPPAMDDDIRLYQNYPHNDLNGDYLIHKKAFGTEREPPKTALQDRYRKDVFSFLSPDTSFNKTMLLNGELIIDNEVYGTAVNRVQNLNPYPLLRTVNKQADDVPYHTTSVAYYNNWNPAKFGHVRRKISECMYVPFNSQVSGGTTKRPIHNLTRDSTVLVAINKDIDNPSVVDNSRMALTDGRYNCNFITSPVRGTACSYYASIVNKIANQYGSIFSRSFVYTNYDNFNVKNDTIIFGGDCFIGAFSTKRQLVWFQNLQTYMTWQDNSEGVDLMNNETISGQRYYYEINPGRRRALKSSNFECGSSYRLPAIVSGIPVFFCESDVNTELRLNGQEPWNTYYPNLKDGSLTLSKWTGVEYVNHDNEFEQNPAYSEPNDLYGYQGPDPFFNAAAPVSINFDTRVVFSLTNSPENRFNNLLVFKPLNYYDFRRDMGALWDIQDLGSNKVLFRFEHGMYADTKYVQIPVEGNKITLGSGKLFESAPAPLAKSGGGYSGTRSQWAFDNTPFGAFMIDSIRGFVFQLGNSLNDISANDADTWFLENLPLSIVEDFPQFANIDNPANPDGVGYLSTYDSSNKVWILTKRDYSLIDKSTRGFYTVVDGRLLYNGAPVSLTNPELFENKSWTFVYSPLLNKWTSWASFIPSFYSGFGKRYFSFSDGALWEHNKGLPRTFYGKRYPFMIEGVLRFNSGSQQIVHACNWLTRLHPIVDGVEQGEDFTDTFNKGIFYTPNQSTGLALLTYQDENKLSQLFRAEVVTTKSKEMFLRFRDNMWQVDDLVDMVVDHNASLFSSKWADIQGEYYIDKVVNHSNIEYSRDYKTTPAIRDFWMKHRLIYDKERDVQINYYFSASINDVSVK